MVTTGTGRFCFGDPQAGLFDEGLQKFAVRHVASVCFENAV